MIYQGVMSKAGSRRSPSVVVIGGGLAGIAAAVRLADAGVAVTLVETRKRLGGRATSFVDPTTGQLLDNCQHVLMGCCTNLIDLYRRLGVAQQIRWDRRLYFADPHGVVDQLEPDDLPAPAHLFRSLMGFRSLTLAEKIAISRAMLAILRLGERGRAGLGEITFGQWLTQQRQPAGAVRKFWSVIVTSALNETPDRASAQYVLQVFQDGFLSNEQGCVMGLSEVPLVRLYDTAQHAVEDSGGDVLLSTGAEELEFEAGRVVGLRLADGQQLRAEAFVSTVPPDRLEKLSSEPAKLADKRLASLGGIGVSPIVGIHLWFAAGDGGRVMDWPHLVLMDSPLQWVFNKGYDDAAGGWHLHGVVSAAYGLVDTPAEKIIEMACDEVRKAVPGVARPGVKLVHGRVVKEKRATFSVAPGIDRLRPDARGAIKNLYLAGDWCRTGWPATMEGAVRSGYLAAAALLEDWRLTARPLVPDLPAGLVYRFCSGGAGAKTR